MGWRRCILCGNIQDKSTHLSFHTFPKKEDLRKQWLEVCKLNESDVKSKTVVCSEHFVFEKDFYKEMLPLRRLKLDAVPSLKKQTNNYTNKIETNRKPRRIIYPQHTITTTNSGTDSYSVNEFNKLPPNPCRNDKIIHIGRAQAVIVPLVAKISNNANNETDKPIEIVGNTKNINKIDVLRVEDLELPDEDPTIVIVQNSPPRAASPAELQTNDIKTDDFSSPEKAKKYKSLIDSIYDQNRERIRQLTKENRQLRSRVEDFEGLLEELHRNKLITDEIIQKFNTSRSDRVLPRKRRKIVAKQEEVAAD